MSGGFAYSGKINSKGALRGIGAVFVIALALALLANYNPRRVQAQPNIEPKIASLTRGDLIVFPDDRIWCVRNNNSHNILFVEWLGNKTQALSIQFFVMHASKIRIVRKADEDYGNYLAKYVDQ